MKCEICNKREGYSDGASYIIICDKCRKEVKKLKKREIK